ncbi:MAG: response regulator [Nostocales cyanobacterium]|nr:MAG: response regulator [Nostocales cyanobacterium]TAF18914.1 MAG: response regulator [Nostocales cyanobacterium]
MLNFQVVRFNQKIKQVIHELSVCENFKYTGQLIIKNTQGVSWKFYYQYGQVIWVTEGIHPHRRLLQNINQVCPQFDLNNQDFTEKTLVDYWDYLLLRKLYANKEISEKDIKGIIESSISEILFDICQQVNSSSLSFEKNQELLLNPLFSSVDINDLMSQVKKSFVEWQEAGLEKINPHGVPVLQHPEQLRQQVSPLVYQNLQRLINGNNTFSELAVKMKKSVVQITRSLLPYIQQNIINVMEVSDLPLPVNKTNKVFQFRTTKNANAPLIACIDDSPQICEMLEKIITAHGMRFIGIQQPLQSLPILIENKPDLIFLDLIMPVMSGYEVCEQLRRCSFFKKTPVVILTGSDGVFDRVRSQVYGATEFVTKPVETAKIIGVVNQYLQPDNKAHQVSKLAFSY